MRVFAAVGLAVLVSAGASAQRRAAPMSAPAMIAPARPAPVIVPSVGALGGNFGSVGMSRPLGGIAPPSVTTGAATRHRPTGQTNGNRYTGPIYYVPSYSDLGYSSSYAGSGYSIFNQPASPVSYYPSPGYNYGPPAQSSQPPVIINQYFGSRRAVTETENGSTTTTTQEAETEESPVKPGDPIGTPQKYYLIAYKNHSIYSALAYWLEGDTLHYVTTQNTHNQASLTLIDLEQTTKLNADASVPFSLAGR